MPCECHLPGAKMQPQTLWSPPQETGKSWTSVREACSAMGENVLSRTHAIRAKWSHSVGVNRTA